MNRIDLRHYPKANRPSLGQYAASHPINTALGGARGLASGLWRLLNSPHPTEYTLPEVDAVDNCQRRL